MIKICTKCKQEKEYKNYYKDKRNKDGLTSWCKQCIIKSSSIWHKNNPDKAYKSSYNYRINNKDKSTIATLSCKRTRLDMYKDILGSVCMHCGTKDKRVLQFHHINPINKDGNIRAMSPELALKELKKCMLLCANCHMLAHQKGGNPTMLRCPLCGTLNDYESPVFCEFCGAHLIGEDD